MKQRIVELLNKLNKDGIPIPLLRDKGVGSYTATMWWISFNLTILFAIGKVSKLLGEVDFWEMLALTGMMGGFYVGRKFQVSKTGGVSITDATTENKEENK